MKSLKNQSLLFIMILCCTVKGFAQVHPNFTFSPEKPANGQPVEFFYDATGTTLAGKKQINAVVYQYRNYQWLGADLQFSGANNKWKAKFDVPADCGLIALKFKSDTLTDNNHNTGYFLILQDKDRPGRLAPGGYVGWGFARSPKYQKDIPGYMKYKGISDTATYMWLNQEITFNQEAKAKLVLPYAIAAKNYLKDGARPKLRAALAYLTRASATEDELLKARIISGELLGDVKLKDSIQQTLIQKFPKGSLARLAAYKSISTNRNMADMVKASEQFLADFPIAQTNVEFDEANYINYGTVYQNLIVVGSYLKKDDSYLQQYVDVLPYNVLSTVFYKIVDIPFNRKEEANARLLAKTELLMKRYTYFLNNQPVEYAYLSPSEWKTKWESERANFEFGPYISLLMSAGRDNDALQYSELSEKYLAYKRATVNNYYASLLQKKAETAKLDEVLKLSFFNNQATTEMLEILKTRYVKKIGSDKGFDQYLDQLKNPADKVAFEKKTASEMMDKQMPEWSMQDMHGKTVTSQSLRGKTVVLDFWATWCVPCKASFPGMKLAVQKYKNDKDVVFYFVDTEERTADYKAEVKKYIQDNKYPFNILFDNKAPGAKATGEVYDQICKAFGISGIPQKLFVDGKGKLRFISVGYLGSPSALADDISSLVDMTKAAK
jgi:thiol-disulfide isomerase/thioredoxin